MSDAYLTPSIRIRRTPFSSRVEQAGRVRRMLLLGFVLSWAAGMAATLLDVGLEAGAA